MAVIVTSVVEVLIEYATLSVLFIATHIGGFTHVVAKFTAHAVATPPVPTVTSMALSEPDITGGVVPHAFIVGAVPVYLTCPATNGEASVLLVRVCALFNCTAGSRHTCANAVSVKTVSNTARVNFFIG